MSEPNDVSEDVGNEDKGWVKWAVGTAAAAVAAIAVYFGIKHKDTLVRVAHDGLEQVQKHGSDIRQHVGEAVHHLKDDVLPQARNQAAHFGEGVAAHARQAAHGAREHAGGALHHAADSLHHAAEAVRPKPVSNAVVDSVVVKRS